MANEQGKPTAVTQFRREIESERETGYLLKSEAMKRRLLEAYQRHGGLPLEAVVEKLGV